MSLPANRKTKTIKNSRKSSFIRNTVSPYDTPPCKTVGSHVYNKPYTFTHYCCLRKTNEQTKSNTTLKSCYDKVLYWGTVNSFVLCVLSVRVEGESEEGTSSSILDPSGERLEKDFIQYSGSTLPVGRL